MTRVSLEYVPGIGSDDTDFSTPGFKDANNVRFWRGKPELIKGWEKLTSTLLTGVCRTVFPWSDGDNRPSFAFGLHNGLTVWQAGAVADITPTSGFTPGQIDGTGGSGYGTGAYGIGGYGEPSTTDYFPMTWSFGARSFGELYANPRGQGIFTWDNNTANKAVLLANAPAECNVMGVAFTDQVLAFGCTDTGGNFNPSCIRGSDIKLPTKWNIATDSTAFQYYLKGNSRIVGAQPVGRYWFVWTESELHLGTFTSSWDFEPVGLGGLAGPNAAVVVGQTAYWISPDYQLWACSLGGAPTIIPCPIRDEFADNAASGQNDKINASYISERGEVLWTYADKRDGFECSRELRLSVLDGAWSRSRMKRTAMTGANPSPVGVTVEGVVYWHERGNSADGAILEGYVETGAQYVDPAENVVLIRGFYPDFKNQTGPIRLQIDGCMEPQGDWYPLTDQMVAPGQRKVDFLGTGRLLRLRLSSASSPAEWRMGKPQVDIVTVGTR